MTYHKQIASGSFLTIKATETATKSPLLLNNQPSVSVTETLSDRVPFSIVVSKTKIGGGKMQSILYVICLMMASNAAQFGGQKIIFFVLLYESVSLVGQYLQFWQSQTFLSFNNF